MRPAKRQRTHPRALELVAFFITLAIPLLGQQPQTAKQTATNSSCSNILALTGNVSLDCSSLTPRQAKALESIPKILDKILTNQLEGEAVLERIEQLIRDQVRPIIQQAPNGINIAPGAVVQNPQVINGPPRPNVTFTEEVVQPFADGMQKRLKIKVRTDRRIAGAVIGFIMSGPYEYDGGIDIDQTGISNISPGGFTVGGRSIPNSGAVTVNIPGAFQAGQTITIPLKSRSDIRTLLVFPLGN